MAATTAARSSAVVTSPPDRSLALIVRTHAQVATISTALRAGLKQQGRLFGPELSVKVVTPPGHPAEIQLAVGDEIRGLQRRDDLGVVNGTVAKIAAVREVTRSGDNAPDIHIEAQVGDRRIGFSSKDIANPYGRARLGWAYAGAALRSAGICNLQS